MSKERELLREIMCYIASGVVSITSNDLGDAAETLHEIQELLAQPEQENLTPRQGLEEYKKGYYQAELDLKREPLSESEIAVIWGDSDYDVTVVRRIEKEHGIGGGNE